MITENPMEGIDKELANTAASIGNGTGANLFAANEPTLGSSGEPPSEDERKTVDGKMKSQNNGSVVKAVESIFNPLTVFRYHKFGPFINGEYKGNLHYDKNLFGGQGGDIGKFLSGEHAEELKSIANQTLYYLQGGKNGTSGDFELFEPGDDQKRTIENPTARTIIDWSNQQDNQKAWSYGPAPYSATDFIYCKQYGKVPNNKKDLECFSTF